MSDTIIVVELETEVVTVVEPGPRGPAGVGGEEIAADLADETAARIAADEALQTAIDDISVEETDPVATAALATHAASTTAHGIGTAAALASDTDNTLAANSDSRLATQKATKGYITTQTGLLVPKSLIDAKGDLLVGTADNTVARKAVGSNGKVLVADSGQSDGLKWGDPPVVPWANWRPLSAKIESVPRPYMGAGTSNSPSSARIVLAACPEPLKAGETYSWVRFLYSTAPTTPTNQWACLIDGATMNVLRSSTDRTTDSIASGTYAKFDLSTPYTPTVDIAKPYVGLVVKASSVSNLLYGVNAPALMVTSSLHSDLFGWGNSGLTTPYADGASVGTVGTGVGSFFPYFLIG